jgi:arylsulfatase A-like enzyme
VGHLVLGEDVAHFERLGAAHVTLGEALADAGYRTAAFTGGVTLDPRIGFDQGFELYTTNMGKISAAQMGPMLRWLAAEPGRPFFLFWHSFEVHAPYTRGRFLPASLSGLRKDLEGLTRELADEAVFASRWRGDDLMTDLLVRHGVDNAETWSDLYDGGIAAADFWVGRLVAYLLDHDLYDSTMIVLTSDHGEELADHDPETFRGWHGHSVYEELLWVPLVVKLPGSEHAGLRIDAVTSGVDVMPTVLDVAGVEGPRARMQGKSLVGLWTGAREADRVAFSEAAAYAEEFKSVRGPRFKLVFEIGPETVARHGRAFAPRVPARRLLFDLSVDPREQRNLLAGTPSRRAEFLAADLETKLRAFVTAEPGEVEEITLDEEALERLRAMGYIP